MYYILDENRLPRKVESKEWAKKFSEVNRIVAQDDLPNDRWIATVFLGISHNGLLFETMVFGPEEECDVLGKIMTIRPEVDIERTASWEQAEESHKRLKEKYESNDRPG